VRRRRLLKLRILEALAYETVQKHDPALDSMIAAVQLGAALGAIRSFVDEGDLCRRVLQKVIDQPVVRNDHKASAHLQLILQACNLAEPGEEPAAMPPVPITAHTLSAREAQILQRLAQGYSNLAVGQQLFVSTNTIKWHLRQIYEKLGAKNRNQAVFLARQHGLLN